MLNRDTLELLQQTAVKADNQVIFPGCPGEPSHVYYVKNPDGSLTKTYADAPLTKAKFYDFISLAKMAKNAVDGGMPVAIWYSVAGVTLVIGADGRNRAAITLMQSKPLLKLYEWDKADGVDTSHAALYKGLRTIFANALPTHPTLKADVTKVDIKKAMQLVSEQKTSKVSLSRDMIAESACADRLPEVLTFNVPVFSDPIAPFKIDVRVAFMLDLEKEAFTLTVLPGEIEAAAGEAEDYLERRLLATISEVLFPDDDANDVADSGAIAAFLAKCPIYRGTP